MEKETIVIKYGSSSVTCENGMDMGRVKQYAQYVDALTDEHNVVIVSSGAVASGKAYWDQIYANTETPEPTKQTYAMMGSGRAFTAWQDALESYGKSAGQLLVTHRELDDVDEGSVVINSIQQSIASGVIPVCNENDALSIHELALLKYGGENDGLASHIARRIGAKALFLLNDTGGIKRNDFTEYETIKISNWPVVRSMVRLRSMKSNQGTGGIAAKVEAAISAAEAGINVYVGLAECDPRDLITGKSGTHFVAKVQEVS